MRVVRGKTEARRLQKDLRPHRREVELCFLLQDWNDPYNVGGIFRVADAAGAQLVLTGGTPAPPHPQISVTSLGNHRRVPFRQFQRHDVALAAMRDEGWQLAAVEIADGAVLYSRFDFSSKVCLVLGNEERGVYPNVLRQCDAAVLIPMAGKGRSLNVLVAGAIVGFHLLFGGEP